MALSFDDVERKLPAGLSRSNEPAYLDLDFIDGTKGAHINISGISGVATKTSYATFLLYSMFTSGVLGAEAANTKALIFNVKGEDLLFLDHGNTALDADRAERYDAMGLAPSPFRDVGILAPPRKGDPNATPATGARHLGVSPFLWTIADFCRMQLLPFLFADAEDERQQYTIVVQAVTAQLAKLAETDSGVGSGGGSGSGDRTSDGAVRLDGRTIRTFGELTDAIEDKLLPADPDEYVDQRWTGRAVGTGTISAFVRRLASARRHVEHLIRADIADASRHGLEPRQPPGHRGRHPLPARPGEAVRGGRGAPAGLQRQGGKRGGQAAATGGARRAQQVRPLGIRRARSRRFCSTWPSGAGRWGSS